MKVLEILWFINFINGFGFASRIGESIENIGNMIERFVAERTT